MKLKFFAAFAFLITLTFTAHSQAATCQLTYSLEGEGPQLRFKLEMPGGALASADCKRFSDPRVEICWHQDKSYQSLSLSTLDEGGAPMLRTHSYYPAQSKVPGRVAAEIFNFREDEVLVVYCE